MALINTITTVSILNIPWFRLTHVCMVVVYRDQLLYSIQNRALFHYKNIFFLLSTPNYTWQLGKSSPKRWCWRRLVILRKGKQKSCKYFSTDSGDQAIGLTYSEKKKQNNSFYNSLNLIIIPTTIHFNK